MPILGYKVTDKNGYTGPCFQWPDALRTKWVKGRWRKKELKGNWQPESPLICSRKVFHMLTAKTQAADIAYQYGEGAILWRAQGIVVAQCAGKLGCLALQVLYPIATWEPISKGSYHFHWKKVNRR